MHHRQGRSNSTERVFSTVLAPDGGLRTVAESSLFAL